MMKKIFLIVAVLMLATPAWAAPTINIWADQNDLEPNEIDIWYDVDPDPCEGVPDGNRPRAFGLNISVDDGNIIAIKNVFEGVCDDVNRGYGIFPGTDGITITDGVPTSWGEPIASSDDPGAEDTGLDTNEIVIEMGSLYTGANTPDPCARLLTIVVSMDCNVSIRGNPERTGSFSPDGVGVVLEDLSIELLVGNVVYTGETVTQVSRFVPDVVGMSQADASTAIEANDLVVGDITTECSDAVDAGRVISTDPVADTEVMRGSSVDMVVSLGPCDWGDAPDPTYPTLSASNGAVHKIVAGVYLGPGPQATSIDAELNGLPNATATGDDIAGTSVDDEDGVVFIPVSGVIVKGPGVVQVTASVAGYLNAWLDLSANGNWSGAGEKIFTDQALAAGQNILPLLVPCGANNGQTVSRWRFTTYHTGGTLDYNGPAEDGEVEDHNVVIACHVPDVCDYNLPDAIADIQAACFNVGVISYECDDVIDACNVIRTEPPYCSIPGCPTDVNIIVSTGPCGVVDPNAGTCWDPLECGAQYAPNSVDANSTGLGGDASCDGNVDFDDLNAVKRSWGETYDGSPRGCVLADNYCCCADFNHDGVVNFDDLNIMKATWGNTGADPNTGEQSCP